MDKNYEDLRAMLLQTGIKEILRSDWDTLYDNAEAFNRGREFGIPDDGLAVYSEASVSVRKRTHKILKIQMEEKKQDKAILYFYGGSFILRPLEGDSASAYNFGKQTGMDVWYPYYPLCIKDNVADAYEMLAQTYEMMLEEYDAENIYFLALSSGGMLAIGTLLYAMRKDGDLPMPKRIISISPAHEPTSNECLEHMKELSERDVFVDWRWMSKFNTALRNARFIPYYMTAPTIVDFDGLPPIDFYFGSDDVALAGADMFEEACRKAGIEYTMNVGEDSCHCYPLFTMTEAGRKAQQQILEALKGQTQRP